MDRLSQDIRYALRQLTRSPAFTVTALLTLALGIGANTAIYSLLDQVMLRSLPVHHPEQLVMLNFSGSDRGRTSAYGGESADYFSYPMYRDLRDKNSVFSGTIATDQVQVAVQWHNQPELVSGELVSGNYFDVLGVTPAIGHLLVQSDDEAQEKNPVVVLSYRLWQTQFAGRGDVVGQTMDLNEHRYTIIGVTPAVFQGSQTGVRAPMVAKSRMSSPRMTVLEIRTHL